MEYTFPSWIFYPSLICFAFLGTKIISLYVFGTPLYNELLEERIAYWILLIGTFIFLIDRVITTYKKYKGVKIKFE